MKRTFDLILISLTPGIDTPRPAILSLRLTPGRALLSPVPSSGDFVAHQSSWPYRLISARGSKRG